MEDQLDKVKSLVESLEFEDLEKLHKYIFDLKGEQLIRMDREKSFKLRKRNFDFYLNQYNTNPLFKEFIEYLIDYSKYIDHINKAIKEYDDAEAASVGFNNEDDDYLPTIYRSKFHYIIPRVEHKVVIRIPSDWSDYLLPDDVEDIYGKEEFCDFLHYIYPEGTNMPAIKRIDGEFDSYEDKFDCRVLKVEVNWNFIVYFPDIQDENIQEYLAKE